MQLNPEFPLFLLAQDETLLSGQTICL